MNHYCLRIDGGRECESEYVEWVKTEGTVIGCYELHNDNSHYHFWIISKKKLQSIRANLKRKFPKVIGNSGYSLKTKEGNLNYICKGEDEHSDPIIVVNTMEFSSDDIDKAHEQYWKDQKKSVKKESKEVESQFHKALDYCKANGCNDGSDGWKICETLIDYYREKVKCEPNDFQLKSMTKSIYTHLVFERAQRIGNKAIYENFRRERARQIIGYEWVHA